MNGNTTATPSGTTPSTELSVESQGISLEKLGDEYEAEKERPVGLNRNAAEFVPTPGPVAPVDYDYQEAGVWVDGDYMWEAPVFHVPHATEVAWMGADMKNICIEFAATGSCKRGDMCRWIHCYL
jgi:hypothetical protein